MTKEERVKLFFKTISEIAGFEIKPEKDFYLVGTAGKSIYRIDGSLNLHYKTPNGTYRPCDYTIFPIFKGAYELEEIKEPLLTDEEKEFLRYLKFDELLVSNHLYTHNKNNEFVTTIYLDNINISFDGLEKEKIYSRKELGL